MITMLRDGSKSSNSNNNTMYINVDLLSTNRLLPKTEMSENINLYKQYLKERNSSNKYRLIFAVNTICSNVLFNRKTEIINNEGSDSPTVYTGDAEYNMVRNTTLSHTKIMDSASTLTYHCGVDIFNNHMLRNKEFLFVNKFSETDATSKCNTIADVNRDENGKVEKARIDVGLSSYTVDSHMYRTDNIMEFLECYKKQLKEKDGWFGFYNSTWLNMPNFYKKKDDNSVIKATVNRVLNNISPCSFVDMYPDRTLFSFVPKYNSFKGRVEENWDYLLTYPYKNDYKTLRDINKNLLSKDKNFESVDNDDLFSAIYIGNNLTIGYTNSGQEIINFTPMFKHNLHVGRYINLYCCHRYSNEGQTTYTFSKENLQIVSVGDSEGFNKDTIFSIKSDDIKNIDTGDLKNYIYFYKQTENGVECDYYFRRYKVFKNGDEIPKSTNSKLAFSRNIYGDNIAQLIYSDDIDINGLKDNLGRDLSEMYLTIIKRNSGYKEWYEKGEYSANTIEYSHCFGKLSSGLYLPDEYTDYNVKYLTNVKSMTYSKTGTDSYNLLQYEYNKLDDDITKDKIIENGDIIGNFVEFSHKNYEEITLSDVYYRFNTAQRELENDDTTYRDIYVDELKYDDYDIYYNSNAKEFTIETKNMGDTGDGNTYMRCNLSPEGYYYNPNFKIQLKDLSENLNEAETILLNVDKSDTGTTYFKYNSKYDCGELVIKSPKKYKFKNGQQICIYNKLTSKTIFSTIYQVENDGITVRSLFDNSEKNIKGEERVGVGDNEVLFFMEDSVPSYAIYRRSSGTYIWRKTINLSDCLSGSSLYNAPFANGATYIQKNINLFLKRQDPENNYGLARPWEKMSITSSGMLGNIPIWGLPKIDLRYLLLNDNNDTNVC